MIFQLVVLRSYLYQWNFKDSINFFERGLEYVYATASSEKSGQNSLLIQMRIVIFVKFKEFTFINDLLAGGVKFLW